MVFKTLERIIRAAAATTVIGLVFMAVSIGLAPTPSPPPAEAAEDAAGNYSQLASQAVEFIYNQYVQGQSVDADTAYILTLAGEGISLDQWVYQGKTLQESVLGSVYKTLKNPGAASAKALAQQLLIAKQWGRTDLADQLASALKQRQKPQGGFDDSVYSDIPAYLALGQAGYLSVVNSAYAREYILKLQSQANDDTLGSWGASFDGTFYPDFLSTCQAIRALTYLPGWESGQEIQAAIDKGLSYLKKHLQDDGSVYVTQPFPEDPVVDTSELIVTLRFLGQDPASWKSSQGATPIDYMATEARNPDGSFGPIGNIMAAAKALHAYLSLGANPQFTVPPAPPARKGFADVNSGGWAWAQEAIETLAGAGIVQGTDGTHFQPGRAATRAEFVCLVVRALKLEGSGAGRFSDVSGNEWFAKEVASAAKAGVVRGFSDNTFRPNRLMTREEAAVMLDRALKLSGAGAGLSFKDRDSISSWARESVARVAAQGIVKGYQDGSFRPGTAVNRAQAAVMVYRALGWDKR